MLLLLFTTQPVVKFGGADFPEYQSLLLFTHGTMQEMFLNMCEKGAVPDRTG